MTVAMPSPHTLEPPSFAASGMAGREIQTSEHLRLAAATERSQDITLHTREGDTVTLSLDQETVAVYGRDARLSLQQYAAGDAGGRQMGYGGMAAESREWLGFEARREFTLSIEGDLSRGEVRDIRKALGRIHRLMDRAFGGETATNRRRSGLGGLDTLAGIEVEIQTSRTAVADRSTGIDAIIYDAGGRSAAPKPVSSMAQPDWSAAAEEAAGIVKETRVALHHFDDPLRHLFRHWGAAMRRHRPAYEPMVEAMAEAVFDRLPA